MARTAVVAGVGPGLGASIARRFASEGCRVALLARTEMYLEELAADLAETPGDGLAVPTDLADPGDVAAAFETIREAFGPVDVLVNNASSGAWKGSQALSLAELEDAWAVGVRGGFCCAREATADMRDGDGGTVIFTGATSSVRGREGALAFSAAKFGVRGMAQSLARELGPEGIHVAHVVVDGQIANPRTLEAHPERAPETFLDPDSMADTYWRLVQQDVATMDFEVHLTNGHRSIEFV